VDAGVVCCIALAAIAMLRAATAAPPTDGKPAVESVRRSIFSELATEEPSMRTEAALAFPGDAWSADDDFYARQQKKARTVASARGVRLGDVLDAFDEGLRAKWPPQPRIALTPGVAPCRPRLAY